MGDRERLSELEESLQLLESDADKKQFKRVENKISHLKKCVELEDQISDVDDAIKKNLGMVGKMVDISSPEVGSRKFAEGDLNKLRLYRGQLVRELKLLRAKKSIQRIKV